MTIPKLHYISQGTSPKEHLDNIQKACSSGAELVQLNLNTISEKKYLNCAMEAREITSHFQTRLIIKEHYKIAKDIKADGVHLEKMDSYPIVRKHLYSWQLIGSTATNLHECQSLIDKEVDYVRLGTFRDIASNDDLGLNGYMAIVEIVNSKTPIIGFGGITIDDVTSILKTGVSGIAVSSTITRDFNTIKLFNELLNASSTAEQRYLFD